MKTTQGTLLTGNPAFKPDHPQDGDQPVAVIPSENPLDSLEDGPSALLVFELTNPNPRAISGTLSFGLKGRIAIGVAALEQDGDTTFIEGTVKDGMWEYHIDEIAAGGTVKIYFELRRQVKAKRSRHRLDRGLFAEGKGIAKKLADDLFCCCIDALPSCDSGAMFKCAAPPPMPEAFGTERYAEYHENQFVDAKREPLSTFGLDVDTASYTTMRRYLQDLRQLPPKDSVRLEEYVNYFPYSYAGPTGEAPVAVNCELAPCPWNSRHRLLRVGVQAKRIEEENLPPSNLVFLLDVSGSMECNGGFDMLKRSMRMLVDRLRPEDSVAIVTYADSTKLHLPATKGSRKGEIMAAVEQLSCGGCTYGAGGIQMAYEEAKRNFDPKANNRVILMTDGDFNVGISSPKELEDFIRGERGNGIFLSILGVGMGNYHDDTMKKLSTAGKGNYACIDSLLEAKKVLVNEFGGTLFTVAKDVKLQLEFNPARVGSYRLLGYESRKLEAQDFNDDKKDGGETGSGHSMTAFYELVPAGAPSEVPSTDPLKYQQSTLVESDELFTVKLRYKEPQGDTSKLLEYPVKEDDIRAQGEPSEDFRFASAVAEFALVVEDSPFKGDADLANAIKRAKGAKGADEDCLRAEFIRLAEKAQLLQSRKR